MSGTTSPARRGSDAGARMAVARQRAGPSCLRDFRAARQSSAVGVCYPMVLPPQIAACLRLALLGGGIQADQRCFRLIEYQRSDRDDHGCRLPPARDPGRLCAWPPSSAVAWLYPADPAVTTGV